MHAYASPSYLQRFGTPTHPRDLEEKHFAVGYLNATVGRVMSMEFCRGEEVIEISPHYAVSVNDARSYISAASAGMGIAQSVRFLAADAIERGELVEVLSDWECESLPLYIVYPQTRHLSNKVRVFVDWLAKLIQSLKDGEHAPPRMLKAS